MSASGTQATITIDAGPEADAEELAHLAQQVRSGLLGLDAVESADLVRTGTAPEGSRGDPIIWGQILVILAKASGGLTAFTGMLQSWASRDAHRKVVIEIDGDKLEITGVSAEGERRLIDNWVKRHAKEA